jgi:hypothetical protein
VYLGRHEIWKLSKDGEPLTESVTDWASDNYEIAKAMNESEVQSRTRNKRTDGERIGKISSGKQSRTLVGLMVLAK